MLIQCRQYLSTIVVFFVLADFLFPAYSKYSNETFEQIFSPALTISSRDFTDEFIPAGIRMLLLVGQAKAGSTQLHSILSTSSRIAGGRVKEPTILDSIEQVSLERYLRFWNINLKNPNKQWLLDGTPENLYYPIAAVRAHRLKALGVNLKVIAILRNPAERAYSDWSMNKRRCEKAKLADHFRRYNVLHSWSALHCRAYAILLKEEFNILRNLGCAQVDTRTVEKYVQCFGKFVKCYSKRVNNTACSMHGKQMCDENKACTKSPFFHTMGLLTKGNYEPQIKMWKASIGEESFLVLNSTQLNDIRKLEESISNLLGEKIEFRRNTKTLGNKGKYRKSGAVYKRGVSTWWEYSII